MSSPKLGLIKMTKHLNQDKLDWLPLRTWPPHSYNSWWSKFIKTNWNNWHEILLNNWKWEHYFNIILKDPNCDLCIKSFFRTGVKVLTESGEKYVWYDLLIQSCLDLKCKINREKIETLDPHCSSLDFKWWQMRAVTFVLKLGAGPACISSPSTRQRRREISGE